MVAYGTPHTHTRAKSYLPYTCPKSYPPYTKIFF